MSPLTQEAELARARPIVQRLVDQKRWRWCATVAEQKGELITLNGLFSAEELRALAIVMTFGLTQKDFK